MGIVCCCEPSSTTRRRSHANNTLTPQCSRRHHPAGPHDNHPADAHVDHVVVVVAQTITPVSATGNSNPLELSGNDSFSPGGGSGKPLRTQILSSQETQGSNTSTSFSLACPLPTTTSSTVANFAGSPNMIPPAVKLPKVDVTDAASGVAPAASKKSREHAVRFDSSSSAAAAAVSLSPDTPTQDAEFPNRGGTSLLYGNSSVAGMMKVSGVSSSAPSSTGSAWPMGDTSGGSSGQQRSSEGLPSFENVEDVLS